MTHEPDEDLDPDYLGPESIDPRVYKALTAAPTPHHLFVSTDRSIEVRLIGDYRESHCGDCLGRLVFAREHSGRSARTLVTCAGCGRCGFAVRHRAGGWDISWKREGQAP